MAKTTKTIKTLSDKLKKVNDGFSISRYDNGYMMEVSGKDENDDYKTAKILVSTVGDLINLVQEYDSMEVHD
jgi:hypothetical protein